MTSAVYMPACIRLALSLTSLLDCRGGFNGRCISQWSLRKIVISWGMAYQALHPPCTPFLPYRAVTGGQSSTHDVPLALRWQWEVIPSKLSVREICTCPLGVKEVPAGAVVDRCVGRAVPLNVEAVSDILRCWRILCQIPTTLWFCCAVFLRDEAELCIAIAYKIET